MLTFLGLFPLSCSPTQGMSLLCGGSAPSAQLSLMHCMLDLVASLASDPLLASSNVYSSASSYAPHSDAEFHKHVRLLQCVSNSAGAGVGGGEPGHGNSSGNGDNLLSDQLELFPPTLMMTAHALNKVKEKQGMARNKNGSDAHKNTNSAFGLNERSIHEQAQWLTCCFDFCAVSFPPSQSRLHTAARGFGSFGARDGHQIESTRGFAKGGKAKAKQRRKERTKSCGTLNCSSRD